MSGHKKIVIVGATSGIAKHCARAWVEDGPRDLVLIGRDAARLGRAAADLETRNAGGTVAHRMADFETPAAIQALADELCGDGAPATVLIAHGFLPDQGACEADLGAADEALRVNGLSPVLFAEAFAGGLARNGGGTVALIGSVAGDRGRKSNYVYGAAKGLIERYAEGLQHRFAGGQVAVVLVKPGPTDTPMTEHLKGGKLKLAPVDAVARQIVRAVDRGAAVVYAPGRWRLIMAVIRRIPRFVFNKLDL